ncbi:MAG: cytochrome P450 [Gammaproteobacteria bacterium]|nr:cytochrome P450 [Gammaproteobacteria bacterium]
MTEEVLESESGESVESHRLTIAEELVLLMLKDDLGFVAAPTSDWRMWCGFAGAVILDLSFRSRVDADLDNLVVIDPTPTGDVVLDPALEIIAYEQTPRTPQYWVEYFAPNADVFIEFVLQRLVNMGILVHDTGGYWQLSNKVLRTGQYVGPGLEQQEEVKARIRRALFDEEIPDPHDVTLIGLLLVCDGFPSMLDADEFEMAQERIQLLASMDLFGQAIRSAVGDSDPASAQPERPKRLPVPKVKLTDYLKSKALRRKDMCRFISEMHEKYGPVFRLAGFGKGAVVLAGADMNQWVARRGRLYLRTRDYLEDFQTAWGTARSIASLDGADHFRMRKIYRAGTSRAAVEDRLDDLFRIGRERIGTWLDGAVVPGEMECQRLTGCQIAQVTTSIDPAISVLDGLLEYEFRALKIYVMKVMPEFMLKTPRMKRYLKDVLEVYRQIHVSHTIEERAGKPRDFVDDLLTLHKSDPQFMPQTDLEFAFLATLIAGHYLGSQMSFALYEMMKNPDCYERVAAEADVLFEGGDPTKDHVTMDAIDFTHRFIMEVMRLHPVIPVHNRMAMNEFEVDDYLVPARSNILVAFTATQYLDEHFKDAEKFDPDRFGPEREEHRKRGAFYPFGLGTHTCLGSRFTELHLVSNLLLVAHHCELEMIPKDYQLKLSPLPKFSPDKSFKFKVKNLRHPLPEAA